MEIIKAENLTFTYPQSNTAALENINISVNSGEFVTVCGKSGCGKSTLLRQFKPIIAPYGKKEGTVYFKGIDISELDEKEQCAEIGFVLQNPDSQIVTDKVWHELAFGLESMGIPTEEIRVRVSETASYFGINQWFDKKTNELSGGQKQILNLASVMVMKPSVLILDEPTSQLDPIAAQNFIEALKKINCETGTTVILSEHRLEEVVPVSDRVIVMVNGQIVLDEAPEKTGLKLKELRCDMFEALPTPIRIFHSISDAEKCPVTVRDARKWLENAKKTDKVQNVKESIRPVENSVKMENVWFRYEKNLPDVICGLSLDVRKGEIYAIVGGNGSGKTTTVSLIGSAIKPYRGKIQISGRTAILPQTPNVLFTEKTVYEDIECMLAGIRADEKKRLTDEMISLCGLENVRDAHPYDLSGGEQQRAALAKVLLANPDTIILDEPTKGIDAHFKKKLASILRNLCENGKTVIIVSHDIEFCAMYADRCAFFFNGCVISEGSPKKMFCEMHCYTTAAHRMADGIIDGAVLENDIISACGGETKEFAYESKPIKPIVIKEENTQVSKKNSAAKTVFGIIFAVLFIITTFVKPSFMENIRYEITSVISIAEITCALLCFIPKKELKTYKISTETNGRLSVRTLISVPICLIAVPLTVLAGIYCFKDKKYYFICMLILIEIMIPFIFGYDDRRHSARETVIISVLCALAVGGRLAFVSLPQFKPVAAIIIISGICFGAESGFIVGAVSGFVSNFYFSQGPWTPWQMLAFGMVGFASGLLFGKGILKKSKTVICVFGFLAVMIIYGGIINPSSVLTVQPHPTFKMIISYYAMGIPFDAIHALSTVFFLMFTAEPLIEKLEKIKIKYGLSL